MSLARLKEIKEKEVAIKVFVSAHPAPSENDIQVFKRDLDDWFVACQQYVMELSQREKITWHEAYASNFFDFHKYFFQNEHVSLSFKSLYAIKVAILEMRQDDPDVGFSSGFIEGVIISNVPPLVTEAAADAYFELAKVCWAMQSEEDYHTKLSFNFFKKAATAYQEVGQAEKEALALIKIADHLYQQLRLKDEFNRDQAKQYMKAYGEAKAKFSEAQRLDDSLQYSNAFIALRKSHHQFYVYRQEVDSKYAVKYKTWDDKWNVYAREFQGDLQVHAKIVLALLKDYAGLTSTILSTAAVAMLPAAAVRFFDGSVSRRYTGQVRSAIDRINPDYDFTVPTILKEVMKEIGRDIEVHGDLAAIMEVVEVRISVSYAEMAVEAAGERAHTFVAEKTF